jgi:hypothetical protein
MANAFGPGSLRPNEPFRLEANQDAVRQTDRDVSLLGKVLNPPFAVGPKEQRLRRNTALTGESGGRLHAWRITPFAPLSFDVEEQARELDVGVAEAVDDGDAVALEDLPRFRCRVSCNEEKIALWMRLGLLDELPGGRRIGASLDLDRDRLGSSGEPENGIGSSAALSRLQRLDRDARDVT